MALPKIDTFPSTRDFSVSDGAKKLSQVTGTPVNLDGFHELETGAGFLNTPEAFENSPYGESLNWSVETADTNGVIERAMALNQIAHTGKSADQEQRLATQELQSHLKETQDLLASLQEADVAPEVIKLAEERVQKAEQMLKQAEGSVQARQEQTKAAFNTLQTRFYQFGKNLIMLYTDNNAQLAGKGLLNFASLMLRGVAKNTHFSFPNSRGLQTLYALFSPQAIRNYSDEQVPTVTSLGNMLLTSLETHLTNMQAMQKRRVETYQALVKGAGLLSREA